MVYDCDAVGGIRQGLRDRDALIHVHADLLLGGPVVPVLQDRQRRFRITLRGGGVHGAGGGGLAVSAAFHFCHFSGGVKLAQLPVFGRKHPCGKRQ